jgi:hypothetical protein
VCSVNGVTVVSANVVVYRVCSGGGVLCAVLME